jgi:hypothetical protein
VEIAFARMKTANSIRLPVNFLIRYVFSALLIASVLATRGNAVAQSSSNAPAISDAQLKAIFGAFAFHGGPALIASPVSEKLGLGTNNLLNQIVTKDHDGYKHVVSIIPNQSGMIFSFLGETTADSYRVDMNLNIVASVSISNHVAHDISDPEKDLQTELKYWANFVDNHPIGTNSVSATNSPPK